MNTIERKKPGMKDGKTRPTVCDCCRIRRIKCDGLEPCWRCITSGLKCTFSAARKRGPRGNGSAVLTLLRQRQGVATGNVPVSELNWATFPQDTLKRLIEAYFEYINPIVPILEKEVVEWLNQPPTEERYALICAVASVPIKRVNVEETLPDGSNLRAMLISECLRVKGTLPFISLQNNVNKAKVSFLLYLTFCSSEEYDTAWHFLHEAVMVAQIMKLDDESSYIELTPEQDLDRRLFYWGLFVSDRGFSIHEHRPVILHKVINLPHSLENSSTYSEFIALIKVMVSMEDGFISAWSEDEKLTKEQEFQPLISRIQTQLLSAVSSAPKFESGIQKSNVLITQPWLLLLLWKVCRKNGTNNNAMFPAYIASLATQVSSTVDSKAMLAHGPGMRKKFYDIGFALAESISTNPQSLETGAIDIKSVLHTVVEMARTLSASNSRGLRLLETKTSEAMQEMESLNSMGWMLINGLFEQWGGEEEGTEQPRETVAPPQPPQPPQWATDSTEMMSSFQLDNYTYTPIKSELDHDIFKESSFI